MSTRSRTRSGFLPKVSESPSVKPVSKSRGNEQSDGMDVDSHNGDGKENIKSLATRSSVAPLSGIRKSKARKPKVRESLRTVDCTCTKGDDGSPMVYCSECRIWYHFTCVDLSEPEAEEINVYVCPTCTVTTGRHSTSEWIVVFLTLCTGVFCTPISPLPSVVFFRLGRTRTKMHCICSLLPKDGPDIHCLHCIFACPPCSFTPCPRCEG
ncbi:hypothetical protein BJ912DRAFT_431180 [Pholiota molesta]|nr:hypothetical protein BJ912DRAFT_431180 [Pholiota molesta]